MEPSYGRRSNQVSWNETEYIKIPQNPYTDKVTDVTDAIQEQFLQTQTMHRKSRTKRLNKWIWVGFPIQWTCLFTFCERHWNESSLRNVHERSDVQVSDEDGVSRDRRSVTTPTTWRSERIWTMILSSPTRSWKSEFWRENRSLASNIEFQPLEPDTDAQLHKERTITVRKAAENLPLEFNTRNVPDEMRTSWKLFDVMKFQEEIKITQKTAVTPHVHEKHRWPSWWLFLYPTSSRQQRSRQVQCCRSRAGELERERARKAPRIGSRGNGARSAWSTRMVREQKSSTDSAERLCTATSKKKRRRISASCRKTDRHNSKAPACNAREKVWTHAKGSSVWQRQDKQRFSVKGTRRERHEDRWHASGAGRTDGPCRGKTPRCKPSFWGWTQPRESHCGVGVVLETTDGPQNTLL